MKQRLVIVGIDIDGYELQMLRVVYHEQHHTANNMRDEARVARRHDSHHCKHEPLKGELEYCGSTLDASACTLSPS